MITKDSDRDQFLTGRVIFLVEDDTALRTIFVRLLTHLGCTVHAAATLEEAIVLAIDLDGRYDLLVSDIELPDGTGWDLQRFLDGHWSRPSIAWSGRSTDDDIASSLQAGFDRHLVKPVTLEILVENMRELLVQSAVAVD